MVFQLTSGSWYGIKHAGVTYVDGYILIKLFSKTKKTIKKELIKKLNVKFYTRPESWSWIMVRSLHFASIVIF